MEAEAKSRMRKMGNLPSWIGTIFGIVQMLNPSKKGLSVEKVSSSFDWQEREFL